MFSGFKAGWDFDVDPMCMSLMQQQVDGTVRVIEEIVIRPNANTEEACKAFLNRAQSLSAQVPHLLRPLTVKVYGDASGNQRRTSGTSTDRAIIKQFFRTRVGTFLPEC